MENIITEPIAIGVGVFVILFILVMLFSVQNSAYKCFKELQKLNRKMDRVNFED
jgi:uncharacterized membrane protein (DUF485 family)